MGKAWAKHGQPHGQHAEGDPASRDFKGGSMHTCGEDIYASTPSGQRAPGLDSLGVHAPKSAVLAICKMAIEQDLAMRAWVVSHSHKPYCNP